MRIYSSLIFALALLAPLVYGEEEEGNGDVGSAYTYPVKSINLDKAASLKTYRAYGDISEDAHPVFGETVSNGFIICGKGMEGERSSKHNGFAVLTDKNGKFVWKWESKRSGDDACNAAVELPESGDILIAGFRTIQGVAKRSITKLDGKTGNEMWTLAFDDKKKSHGAFEMIRLSSDKKTLYASGLYKKPNVQEMAFKSYGNAPAGKAIMHALRVSSFTGKSAPSLSAAISWTATFDSYMSAKDVVEMPVSKKIAVLLWTEEGASMNVAIGTKNSWSTKRYSQIDMEPTALAVSIESNKEYIVITGHGGHTGEGRDVGISGNLAKIDSKGNYLWSKSFSAGGTPELIYNECWGVSSIGSGKDAGFVLSCGTGIEGCQGFKGTMLSNCRKGKGDPRPGAIARPPAVWQSLLIRTDLDGELLWQRVDSFRGKGNGDLGTKGFEHESSAAEWVVVQDKGTIAVISDEGFGVGLMILDEERSGSSPTSSPTKRTRTDFPTRLPTSFPTRRPTKSPIPFACSNGNTLRQCRSQKYRKQCVYFQGNCVERTAYPTRSPTSFPTRRPTAPFSCTQLNNRRCRWKKHKEACVVKNGKCQSRESEATIADCPAKRYRPKCLALTGCTWTKPAKKFGKFCTASSSP